MTASVYTLMISEYSPIPSAPIRPLTYAPKDTVTVRTRSAATARTTPFFKIRLILSSIQHPLFSHFYEKGKKKIPPT